MKNEKHKKYWVFTGRWQPLHFSHMKLIETKLKDHPVLILVRDIPPDEKNPFTTEQTIQMLEKVYEEQDVKVMKIPDILGIAYGRGVGYTIEEIVLPLSDQMVSATAIRNSIRSGSDDWKENVDESIHSMVIDFLNENGFL